MNERTDQPYRHPLLIETIASKLSFDRLSELLFDTDRYAPHTLVITTITVGYVLRLPLLLREPWRFSTSAAIIAGLLIGLWGTVYMRDGYTEAIKRLKLSAQPNDHDPSEFTAIIPFRVQVGAYTVFLLTLYYHVTFNIGIVTFFEAGDVPPELFRLLVACPVAYVPIIVDFAVLFISIQFALPRRLQSANIDLFFFDPRNMGGFAPIGQLLKRSYYAYTAGLLAYFAFAYIPAFIAPVVETPYEPTPLVTVFFSLAWATGLISIVYSMWTIHRLMASKKEDKLRELEAELHSVIDQPYDIGQAEIMDEDRLSGVTRRIEEVRSTREYPTTFAMWSQILISVILPQALNMAVQVV